MNRHRNSLVYASQPACRRVCHQRAGADNSQQAKMTSCNAQAKAKNLSGDDRKAFMKTCLSAAPPPAAPMNSQQQKMKDCNASAKTQGLTRRCAQAVHEQLPEGFLGSWDCWTD